MIDADARDRRSRMIAALVEDMIRLAPLIQPPLTARASDDVRGWAQDLALMADYLYDAAEAAVDCELAMPGALPAEGRSS